MAPRARLLSAVLAACLLAAPAAGAPLRAPGVERLAGGALLLMPVRVEVFEVASGGLTLLRPEWTSSARAHVEAALEGLLGDGRTALTPYEAPGDPERAARHTQVLKVHRLVQQTIVVHHYGHAGGLPSKQGRFDWSVGPGAAALRGATTDARWALFLEISDRRLGEPFVRFGTLGDELAATASLLDLTTGGLLWFNHERTGGLRSAAETRDTLRRLLRDLPL